MLERLQWRACATCARSWFHLAYVAPSENHSARLSVISGAWGLDHHRLTLAPDSWSRLDVVLSVCSKAGLLARARKMNDPGPILLPGV